jgi:hypothetical protein
MGSQVNDNSITVTAIEFEKHLCSQNGKYIRASYKCRTIRRSIIQSNTEEGFKALICFGRSFVNGSSLINGLEGR